mmetsp:Transcript_31105/g.78571  ORF Transcript_31105/g.78571 Transcript_31105/m.78571 type:complete len:305 (+) Transcript_31105:297-1211(+)
MAMVRCPRSASALGSAPITSPRPPVLDHGAISAPTITTFMTFSPARGTSSAAPAPAASASSSFAPAAAPVGGAVLPGNVIVLGGVPTGGRDAPGVVAGGSCVCGLGGAPTKADLVGGGGGFAGAAVDLEAGVWVCAVLGGGLATKAEAAVGSLVDVAVGAGGAGWEKGAGCSLDSSMQMLPSAASFRSRCTSLAASFLRSATSSSSSCCSRYSSSSLLFQSSAVAARKATPRPREGAGGGVGLAFAARAARRVRRASVRPADPATARAARLGRAAAIALALLHLGWLSGFLGRCGYRDGLCRVR